MNNLLEQPDLADDDFEDIEYADVKEEIVDPEEGMHNIKEDGEHRESMKIENDLVEVTDGLVDPVEGKFNIQADAECKESTRVDLGPSFIKVVPTLNSKTNGEPVKNFKKDSVTGNSKKEEIKKVPETPSQNISNGENSRNSSTRPQRQNSLKSTRSLLKAHRPRLGYCGRYDAFGLYVAKKLENLPDRMSIFAQKMISDVLFEAEMGSLNRHSKVIGHKPLYPLFEKI